MAAAIVWGSAAVRHGHALQGAPGGRGVGREPDALARLRAGNERFAHGRRTLTVDTAHDAQLRGRLVESQHPFAAVLCCADSRVCPELIFDQPLGTLFEIRNAGNVVDDDVEASMEYAVEHLHVSLILVMGHKRCGAIAAVHEAGERPLPDHLHAIQDHMRGIHDQVVRTHDDHSAALLDQLSKENARQQALELIHESHVLREAAKAGKTRVMFGLYDLATGRVEFDAVSP
jgi:carbonic anhydrase